MSKTNSRDEPIKAEEFINLSAKEQGEALSRMTPNQVRLLNVRVVTLMSSIRLKNYESAYKQAKKEADAEWEKEKVIRDLRQEHLRRVIRESRPTNTAVRG